MNLGLLVLRLIVGLTFAGHGAQKLFGAFGGPGLGGMAAGLEQSGIKPGRPYALIAGCAELFGGLLLAAGWFTPFAAAALTAVMTTAVLTVHLKNGFWNTNGGFEFNLALVAALFALSGAGPGEWSLDNAFGWDLAGSGWALLALAAGVLGGLGTLAAGRFRTREAHRGGAGHPRPA